MTAQDTKDPDVTVMMSGGFALAYGEILPEFEAETGLSVETLSGASQGQGPRTIRHQLEHGTHVDVVIMSNEGLSELVARGRVAEGTATELATTPLGAAVRAGVARPDVTTLDGLKAALLAARLVVMPGSTSGLVIRDEVVPRLGIEGEVRVEMLARGTDSTGKLAAGEADIALGPVSELVNVAGIDYVDALPGSLQLVQTFTAAILRGARDTGAAARLTAFLSSDRGAAAIRRAGMEPVVPTGH